MDDPDRYGRHVRRNLLPCRRADGESFALVPRRRPVPIAPRPRMPRLMIKTWILTALATLAAFTAVPAAAQSNVYVMRHLNTPAGQPDPDLLPEGQRPPDSRRAWARPHRRPQQHRAGPRRRPRRRAARGARPRGFRRHLASRARR